MLDRPKSTAVILLVALTVLGPVARPEEPSRRGALVIVGGGPMPDEVRDKFMALAGGKGARLVVIPTASESAGHKDEEEGYLRPWRKYEPAALVLLHTRSRATADDPAFARPIAEASAVWFGGGDQAKLIEAYRGTAVDREFRALLDRGGVIGGTSAGAAVMSDVMIEGGNPKADVGRGFGFVTGAVVDQHFLKRDRFNRLLSVIADRPQLIGLGIDESTALVLEGDRWSVLGKSYVMALEAGKDGQPPRVQSFARGDRGTLPSSGFPTVTRGAANSLQAKYGSRFAVGVALGGRLPDDYSDWERKLITDQFGSITPENCMKMTHLQPREGEFDFAQADALVAFAQDHRMQVCGHTLVWAKDDRTPPWVFLDGDKPASRELVLGRMRTHIKAVVTRYRGKVASWDVVNEALGDGDVYLRESRWKQLAGPEFVAKAFEWAREADPDALLLYNDYNVESPRKRAKLIRLIGELREKNVPLGAIGIQGHWEVDRIPFQDIETLLASMKELGLKVMVSELDLGLVPRGPWYADGGKDREAVARTNPLAGGCPPELLERQARQYAELFKVFRDRSDSIARVTFWDLHDGRSWLNDFPWKHAEYPLLFDREGKPKPAFGAVMGVD